MASHWRLTEQLLEEARRFELRSACRDCFFLERAARRVLARLARRGPAVLAADAPGPDGERPDTVAFCKEFELR